MFFQIPIIFTIVYQSYIGPIEKLNKNIARFYTGIDEAPDMKLDSWSSGMNNVILFFQKSLEILRVFKDELRDGRKLRSEVEIASEIQKQSLSQEHDILP